VIAIRRQASGWPLFDRTLSIFAVAAGVTVMPGTMVVILFMVNL
jgi:hypothetical protein